MPLAVQPAKKKGFTPEPWMFAVGIAVLLIVGAIIVGYLRNRSTTTQTTATQPTATPSNVGTESFVTQSQWDATEAALGTQYQINQGEQAQIGTLQTTTASQATQIQAQLTQLQQLQAQLAANGQTDASLQSKIDDLQKQLAALQTGPVSQPPPPSQSSRSITVTPWPTQDSTLWGIAQHYLGNGNRWPEIWKLNPGISNPNLIYANQQVIIPNA